MIQSKLHNLFIHISLCIIIACAASSSASAQGGLILPWRDIVRVLAANSTPPADPGDRSGYAQISDVSGYFRYHHLDTYIRDTLRLAGADSLDQRELIGNNILIRLLASGVPLDSVAIQGHVPTYINSFYLTTDSVCILYSYFDEGVFNPVTHCIPRDSLWPAIDTAANCINVALFGILPDGTDQTDNIYALLDYIDAQGGGCIQFNEGVYRIDSLIRIPNDGGSPPYQNPLRITGTSSIKTGTGVFTPDGGTILDLRMATGAARIITNGAGALTIENITFQSVNASASIPFLLTTNTTLNVRNCGFYGRNGVTAADETAIMLGAQTAAPVVDGTDDAPFQGYGTVIESNWFNQIERGVYGGTYCNGVIIQNNTWWNRCGGEVAIEINEPSAGQDNVGNLISGNLIEMIGYDYGIKLTSSSRNNIVYNNFYDPGVNVITNVYFASDAPVNLLIEGYNGPFTPSYIDSSESLTLITPEQGVQSVFNQGLEVHEGADLWNSVARTWLVHHPSNGRYFYQIMEGLGIKSVINDSGDLPLYKGERSGSASHFSLLGGDNNRFAYSDGGVRMTSSTGSPEGVKTAPVGSTYHRSDGDPGEVFYIKHSGSGNTGWIPVPSTSGSDSTYSIGNDTLCFIVMGDTTCVPLDSIYITEDSICYIVYPDTVCIPYNQDGLNIYNGNGTLTGNRIMEMDFKSLRFYNSGTEVFSINPAGIVPGRLLNARISSTSDQVAMLELTNANSNLAADSYIRYNAGGSNIRRFALGINRGEGTRGSFMLSDTTDLNKPVWTHYFDEDSTVFHRDMMIESGLIDGAGDYGTSGQVLTSTGTNVLWDDAPGGAIPINDLQAADGTNTINNAAYAQEWQWNTLASGSGLKLSSTSTAAASNTQRLLHIDLSGANATGSQTTYGGYFSNTHTGTTPVNYGVAGISNGSGLFSAGVYGLSAGNAASGVLGDGSSTGVGVWGQASTSGGYAGYFSGSSSCNGLLGGSSSGFGVIGSSASGISLAAYKYNATLSAVDTLLELWKVASGTPAAGLGGAITYKMNTTNGNSYVANSLISKWSTATSASRSSQFVISGVNSATTQDLMTLAGSGELTLNQYTTANHNGGTAADSFLVVSATGVVKKRNAAGVGGGGSSPSAISPSQLTADVDDYNPTGMSTATLVRLSSDNGMWAITSIAAGSDWEEKKLINIGSHLIYIPMEHPDGTAANRFTGENGDFILYPGGSADIMYDGTSDRWRILSTTSTLPKKGLSYNWSAGSATDADWGDIGFGLSNATKAAVAATTSLPGCIQFSTGVSSAAIAFGGFSKGVAQISSYGAAYLHMSSLISVTDLSDATNRYIVSASFATAFSGVHDANNTCGIRYSDNINSGKFEGYSINNGGTPTVVDLGITVAAATLYRLDTWVDKSNGETRFYINGVFCGRITANRPTTIAVLARTIFFKTVGTTARLLNLYSMSASAIYP